jgi:DNA-binding GntR family transcriptional regulator
LRTQKLLHHGGINPLAVRECGHSAAGPSAIEGTAQRTRALCGTNLYVRYVSLFREVDGVTAARDIATNAPAAPALPPRDRTRRNLPTPNNQKIATLVHQRLREDILSLALKPGTAVSEKELSLSYGVGRTPVREALLRLADEGLVEVVPKSGTVVTRIPMSKLPQAIVIRKALEDVAVRAAASRASISDLMGLRMLLQRQSEAAVAGDEAAFHTADEDFHAAIAEAAGYPDIWELVKQVKVEVDRYRRLTLPQTGRMLRVERDHAAVADALEARDAEAASRAMAAHLDTLQLSIEEIRGTYPDYFAD